MFYKFESAETMLLTYFGMNMSELGVNVQSNLRNSLFDLIKAIIL